MAIEVVKEERILVLVRSFRQPVFDPKTQNEIGTAFQSVEHVYDRKLTLSDGSVLTDQVTEKTRLDAEADLVAVDMVKAIQSVADKIGAEATITLASPLAKKPINP